MTTFAMRIPTARNSRSGSWYFALGFLVAVSALVAICSPLFTSSKNLSDIAAQVAPLVICAIGQALVVIIGGLDLSVGSLLSLTTVIITLPLPAVATISLLIAVTLAIGAVNGVGVAYLNVHPLIMTLASMSFVQGIALLIRPAPGGTVPAWLMASVNGNIFSLPNVAIWLVAAIIAGWSLLYRSRFGLHLFSIGGNKLSAHLNGVPAARCIVLTYVLCSIFATAAGLLLAARIASGDAYVGSAFGIDSISAAAVGGISLSGGIGSLVGPIIGSVLIGVIGNGMDLMNVSAFLQTVLDGALLLTVVSFQRRHQIGL
jgi:ribose transport system permease protein